MLLLPRLIREPADEKQHWVTEKQLQFLSIRSGFFGPGRFFTESDYPRRQTAWDMKLFLRPDLLNSDPLFPKRATSEL